VVIIRFIDTRRYPARGFFKGFHQEQETNGHTDIPYPDKPGRDWQVMGLKGQDTAIDPVEKG
jgi:hypothetical protein